MAGPCGIYRGEKISTGLWGGSLMERDVLEDLEVGVDILKLILNK
jgi:hypothetical protein